MSEVTLSHRGSRQGKRPTLPPVELSDEEVERLVYAFIRGKISILEEDVLAVVRWAQRIRMGAMLLQMVLDGEIIPEVQNGEVYVGLPQRSA